MQRAVRTAHLDICVFLDGVSHFIMGFFFIYCWSCKLLFVYTYGRSVVTSIQSNNKIEKNPTSCAYIY